MVAKIKAEVGPVDILVNNAGLMKRVPMVEMSHADFMRVIDVHVGGAFNCSKAVLPDMMEKHEGKIINICSMMSELGRETVSAYAAAKGALKMLTKNIASEYGEYNIQCNGMGPGYIATAQTAPLREVQPDGSRHPFDQRACARGRALLRWAKFSFACQKRTRKAPAISTRWIHEKGAARPFQTPKELSKPKNASRFAKRIFLASPICCFAAGVTSLLTVTSSKGVKSAAKP